LESPVYPPISEDAEETRRVEENLRRWEVAERQRRKAARGSQSFSAPSLVSDVSRRASLLFSRRKGRQQSISTLGNHAALQSQDSIDVVPLTYSVHHAPSPTRSEHERDLFTNPSTPVAQVTISPFDDVYAVRQMSPPATSLNNSKDATRRGPLNLPSPRSPPPIFPEERNNSEAVADVRWWHDWLCGCGEGPDRGGDSQAGHTNPLE